jgi:hypothetical protein
MIVKELVEFLLTQDQELPVKYEKITDVQIGDMTWDTDVKLVDVNVATRDHWWKGYKQLKEPITQVVFSEG